MSRVVAGVDGGGSGSRAVILDAEGRELARVAGPSALVDPVEPGGAARVVAELVRRAAEAAGITLPVSALWAGLAGAGREEPRAAVEGELASAGVADRIRVGNDVDAAFRDAFPGHAGILLVAGTGSIAMGRRADGAEHRAGGWGSLMGDEGSGYEVGIRALRAIAGATDGRGPGTGLATSIPAVLGVEGPAALISWAASAGKDRIAALVPLVTEAARGGDEVAYRILEDAAQALLAHVRAVESALEPWPAPPSVALSGGLVAPGGPLRSRIEAGLRERGGSVRPDAVDPARGAALLALALVRDAAG